MTLRLDWELYHQAQVCLKKMVLNTQVQMSVVINSHPISVNKGVFGKSF